MEKGILFKDILLIKESSKVKLAAKEEDLTQAIQIIIQKEEKDNVSAELLEVRKENWIIKNKLSNDNKAAEVKLISKEEELTNALTKNIEHEQALQILKEHSSTKFS